MNTRSILSLAVCLMTSPALAEPAPTTAPYPEHVVVFRREGVYASFPDLDRLPDGRLLVQFAASRSTSHLNFRGGGRAQMTSSDGGRTWTETNEPFLHNRWRTTDGRLVTVKAEGWLQSTDDHAAELKAAGKFVLKADPPGTVGYLGGILARTSDDGGKTWHDEPVPVPAGIAGVMNHTMGASEVVTRSGTRVAIMYGPGTPDETGRYKPDAPLVIRSTDDGRSWTCRRMFDPTTPLPEPGFNETAVTQMPDGRLIALMRPTSTHALYQTYSPDDGLTWTPPTKTTMGGIPAHVLALDDGRLVCTFGYRKKPMGVRAAVSNNAGASWDAVPQIVLRDDSVARVSDVGYPVTVDLGGGELFTIYYITPADHITQVAGTRWRVPRPIP